MVVEMKPREKLENYLNLQSYNQLFMRDYEGLLHFYKQFIVTLQV